MTRVECRQSVMKRILNNWGTALMAAAIVAVPTLICGTVNTMAEGEAAEGHELLYFPVRDGNVKDQPLVLVGVIDRKAAAPTITMDGKEIKTMKMAVAEFGADWKGYETHFYKHAKDGKPLKNLEKKNVFVACIPTVATGARTLTIDGVDYKFTKVSSKDKEVTESYSHHSPFKVRNNTGILPFKCEECHKVTEADGKKTLGFAGTENCKHCHKDLSNHKHDMDLLKECNICHDPHGSVIPKRLR